jgi:thiosulfate dehydrogenase
MEEYALQALVAFMKNETTDVAPYISSEGTVTGDPASGRELYEGTCASCHGVDGKKLNFGSADEPEFVGTIAADNPWEFFHKASFGNPGAPMPAGNALGWTLEQIADLLAYAQTLPTQ